MSLERRNVREMHATDQLPEYSRGELPEGERAVVQDHLASCPACRRELDLLQALLEAPEPRLEPAEAERLYTPLAQGRRRGWAVGRRRAGVWQAAAGLAVVLAGYGVWLASRSDREADRSWSAEEALAGWDADLAELRPEVADLQVALGGDAEAVWPDIAGESLAEPDALNGAWEDLD